MKEFILASKNQNKAREIQEILGEGYTVITQTQAGAGDIDVIEDGVTFEENAIKKAETVIKALNRPVIADDSGLCVGALGGEPGLCRRKRNGQREYNKTFDRNGRGFV